MAGPYSRRCGRSSWIGLSIILRHSLPGGDSLSVPLNSGYDGNMVPVYQEIIEFIAAGTTPRTVAQFQPSQETKNRVADLIHREKTNGLTPDEASELDYYLELEHLMRLTKACAQSCCCEGQFAQDARSYCAFIDGLVTARPADCYTRLLRILSSLAASGNSLPHANPEPKVGRDLRLTHEEWSELARKIGEAIAPEVSQLVDRHSNDESELARVTMLWDDLADLYRDLKEGLDLFALGTPDARSAAIANWQFGYEAHWGRHLMRALMTVYEVRFDLQVE